MARPERRYWTLGSRPDRYRAAESIAQRDDGWWRSGRARIRKGDRVAIWQYKGHGQSRGVIAFGEVLTDPVEITNTSDPYWSEDDPLAGPSLRVRVRYTIRPVEPLWLEASSPDSVLRKLSVARATGGTAFTVTDAQWAELMDLVGGWPTDPVDTSAGEPQAGEDWTPSEVEAVVTQYLAMLAAEAAGQPYVKRDHNRAVRNAASTRSHGSVEFKFANISAVMQELGLHYVRGYLPRGNYQEALAQEIRRRLATDGTLSVLANPKAPQVPQSARLIKTDAPPPGSRRALGSGRAPPRIVDYGVLQAENRSLGFKGEALVLAYERAWLTENGRADLADRVRHVAVEVGDGLGYDVASFQLDGRRRYVEVKTTAGGIQTPFYLSSAEIEFASQHEDDYVIHRVYEYGPEPKFFIVRAPLAETVTLEPVTFRARLTNSPVTEVVPC